MFLWILTALAAVAVDQLTKYLAVEYLKPVGSVPLIKDVLHLTYVENTGAAFGMLKDQRWLFMIVSTAAIIGLAVYMIVTCRKAKPSPLFAVAMGLVIGGGIGNMIDRVLAGYVVDFIDFTLINFAVFNGADSCVCVGAGLLFLCVILAEVKESHEKKAAEAGKTDTPKSENGKN